MKHQIQNCQEVVKAEETIIRAKLRNVILCTYRYNLICYSSSYRIRYFCKRMIFLGIYTAMYVFKHVFYFLYYDNTLCVQYRVKLFLTFL